MICTLKSDNENATELIGQKIGANLRGGEVIKLIADLGGGKTTFTRGLVRGAGSQDQVTSPSFTLSNQYIISSSTNSKPHVIAPTYHNSRGNESPHKVGVLANREINTIYHFDFYRLSEAGIMADELAELIGQKDCVIVVEWGELVAEVLPKARLTIRLTANDITSRTLNFTYPASLKYLLVQ